MATIQTSIKIFDGMTPAFRNMTTSINTTINSLERLQQRLHNPLNTGSIQASQQNLNNIESILTRIEQKIGRNTNEQENFNNKIRQGSEAGSLLVSKLKSIAGIYIGIKGIESITKAADTIASTKARLALMNDGLQTTEQLNKMIYLSAQSARASYADTAAQVSKLGILAGESFGSSAEVVKFAELMNKAFVIGGTSASEASAAMYQLTQAMAAGKLQGDEFRSIMENAPLLATKIAESMGKSKEELKDLSRTGAITADVIRNALFKASDEIEKKFESMPITFSQALTMMKNDAYMIFGQTLGKISGALQSVRFSEIVVSMRNIMIAISSSIYDTLNIIKNILNSDFFSDFVQGITLGAVLIIQGLGGITNAALNVANIFAQNWSTIAPIIYGVAIAIGIYTIAAIALAVANKVASLSASWFNFQMTQTVIMHELATGATWMQVAAQYGLNAALYACPITWVVLGIIAVISAVFILVAVYNHFAGTNISVISLAVGAWYWLCAVVYNVISGIVNALNICVVGIANAFRTGLYAVQCFFIDMANAGLKAGVNLDKAFDKFATNLANGIIKAVNIAVKGLNWLVEQINKIPGINLPQMKEFQKVNTVIGTKTTFKPIQKPSEPKPWKPELAELKNLKSEFIKGYDIGHQLQNKLKDTFDINKMLEDAKDKLGLKDLWDKNKHGDKNKYGLDNNFGSAGLNSPLNDAAKGAKDTAGNTAKMAKTMDKSQEDLKYLRDIAEQETINRFTGVNIKIDMNNINNISKDTDVDGIVNVLTEKLNDAMVVSAEGIV
ncbi:TPA: tape measure protein [Clostridioides difficile]|nr:tape measure protein [Clostridioides difficile]HBG0458421.1 tape measure protein [Clostridioides difficile]